MKSENTIVSSCRKTANSSDFCIWLCNDGVKLHYGPEICDGAREFFK